MIYCLYMKISHSTFLLIITITCVGFFFLLFNNPPSAPAGALDDPKTPYIENSDSLMIGKITEILSSEQTQYDYDGDNDGRNDQEVTTKLIAYIHSGDEAKTYAPITLTQTQEEFEKNPFTPGDKIIIGKNYPPDAPSAYYIYDKYRLNSALLLGIIFLICTTLFAGYRGLSSFLGLVLTMTILFFITIPSILSGKSPLLICSISSILIATLSIIVAHGKNRRTILAVLSTSILVCLAILFSLLTVWLLRLSGLGTEEAYYLQMVPNMSIDIRGLLLGGILLGVLGVLDDITTAQAAVVEEIHRANTALNMKELYARGVSVGKEHITSLVNTLVLAYTGASFPLLLLFFVYPRPWWTVLNSDIVMEEIARTFVGSIILVLAVPITTALAAWSYAHKPLNEQELGEGAHKHHHGHGHHH
jgi:uncharacterized membrane protein